MWECQKRWGSKRFPAKGLRATEKTRFCQGRSPRGGEVDFQLKLHEKPKTLSKNAKVDEVAVRCSQETNHRRDGGEIFNPQGGNEQGGRHGLSKTGDFWGRADRQELQRKGRAVGEKD